MNIFYLIMKLCIVWWFQCSSVCGKASRYRKLLCIEVDTLEDVDQSYCRSLDMPAATESCDLDPCIDWLVDDWSEVCCDCSQNS